MKMQGITVSPGCFDLFRIVRLNHLDTSRSRPFIKLVAAVFVLLSPNTALLSQQIPAESASGTLIQRVGLSDVTVTYSRPNVNNRRIWGALVPYQKVWRTGADSPTIVTFTDLTTVEGRHSLPPGKYALYTIPAERIWTIIFSKNTKLWGAFGYKQEDDAMRVEVKPMAHEFTETFTIDFSEVGDNRATIVLQWERLRVPLRIEVDIHERVLSSIKSVIADEKAERILLMSTYWKGAKYLLKHNLDLDLAMTWIDKSIELEADWVNLWVKAQLLAARRDYRAALEYGMKALEKGRAAATFFPYEQTYTDEMKKWRKSGQKTSRKVS